MAKHRVVAAVLHRDDRVLLCHRHPDRRWYPAVWDLPGGHIDDGESPAAALVRELIEELTITIEPPTDSPVLASELDEETSIVIWAIGRWSGEPTNAAPDEHDRIGWFSASEIDSLEMADPEIARICCTVLGATGEPEV